MNLKFLETFVWVARLKSFRLTADKLFTTQASISSRIAVLESELGVKLFLRDSRGVSLTPEGLKVLEYAEQMMDTMQALKQSIETRSSKVGRVRIGVMDTVIHTWLSPLVAQMTDLYPLVEIELVADTSLNLCDQLQKGFLDLILQTDLMRQESVRSLELASHPMGWIAASNSLYNRDYSGIADLARERIITYSKNSHPHQEVLALMQANGVMTPRLNCVNSVSAITRLLRDGFGIGARRRREQCLGIAVLRIIENLISRAVFDGLPVVHDHDVIGHIADDREIVADEDIGQVQFVLQIGEQVQHLCLHRQI